MNTLKLSAVLTLLTSTGICRADPFDTWTWLSPNPPFVSLYSIAYGNGQFVAVGGTILTSADGTNWVDRHWLAPGFLRAVAYGGGVFAAVGDSGSIVTSTDGADWSPRLSLTNFSATCIAYGNGRFVIAFVGENDTGLTFATSTNGLDWIQSQQSVNQVFVGAIAYGNGQFVAVGSHDLDGSAIFMTSPDGMNWVQREPSGLAAFILRAIAYGNGQFVAVGYSTPGGSGSIATSSNGVDWVEIVSGIQYPIYSISFGNGTFFAVGQIILTSTNTVNWIEHPNTNTFAGGHDFTLHSVAYGGSQVAVGDFGAILNSVDGVNWTPTPRTSVLWPDRISYGMGQFVGVTGDTIVSSTDGGDWSPRFSLTNFWATGVAYGNGRFVVPFGGQSDTGPVIFATSTNGLDWIQSHQSMNAVFVDAIAYGNGQFVALGYVDDAHPTSIASSTDGVNWTWRQSGTTDSLTSITYGNGQFVAVGGGGGGFYRSSGLSTIITSADGVNWIPRAPEITYFLRDVTYGNGQFVAVSGHVQDPLMSGSFDFGSVITSTDGINWVLRLSQVPGGLWQVAYGNGNFVAIGGPTITSRDGVDWTEHTLMMEQPPDGDLGRLYYVNGHFIAGGLWTLESDSVIGLSLMSSASNGRLTLSLEGPTGLAYAIESSTNLISWQTLTNLTSAQPTTIILDPIPATSEPLFYRAYSQ